MLDGPSASSVPALGPVSTALNYNQEVIPSPNRLFLAKKCLFYVLLLTIVFGCTCSKNKAKRVETKTREELLEDLGNGDVPAKVDAIKKLEAMKDPEAVAVFTLALDDSAESVKIAAAAALGRTRNPQASEVIWKIVGDPKQSPGVRLAAARALAALGDARAADPLIQALPRTYPGAAESLRELGKAAVPPLINALRDAETRDNASKVLISMGDVGVEALIDLLRHSATSSERLAAAATLADMGTPSASDALDEALKNANTDVEFTGAVYRYLIRRGKPASEAQLIRALNTLGKLTMAEDFAASGNANLKTAAEEWARKRSTLLDVRIADTDVVYWAGVDPSIKQVGLYHFDKSLTNTSGTAPVQSVGTSFVPGKWGSALSVEKGGVLKYPLNGNLSLQDGTIEMWICPRFDGDDPVYSKYNHVLLLYHSQAGNQFLVSESVMRKFYAGTVVNHQFKGASGGDISLWKAGTWHHIAFTYASRRARQRLFIDGVISAENNAAIPDPGSGADAFTVGCDPYKNFTGFLVDELQVSNGEKGPSVIRADAARKEPFTDR